jgi:hypothetical protein
MTKKVSRVGGSKVTRRPRATASQNRTARRALEMQHRAVLVGIQQRAINAVPTTWLDSLLTGPDAVIGKQPFVGTDIERLLTAIRKRVSDAVLREA